MNFGMILSRNRIFILALFASVLWHIFWLTAVSIVVSTDHGKNMKFSKVSFLGPILGRGALELRVTPKARSFLEKRFFSNAADVCKSNYPEETEALRNGQSALDDDGVHSECGELNEVIADVLEVSKPEPAFIT